MGFLKKLFGGKDEKEEKARRPAAPPSRREPPPDRAPEAAPEIDQMNAKQLARLVGQSNRQARGEAAERLKELGDRTTIRPLIISYLNYGDPPVLDAIAAFGSAATATALHEVHDLSNVSSRRARLMDILGATGDPTVASAVRDEMDASDVEIHVRACVALARLGDTAGIDKLASDMQQATKDDLRREALKGLAEIRDMPAAREAIDEHVARYLGERGAIPEKVRVSAPRLTHPDTPMTAFIIEEIKKTEHDLVVVIGSGASDMARNRSTDLRRGLADHDLYLLSPQVSPEEQMTLLEEARDKASSDPEHTVLAIGQVPAPGDSPPLRHFLTPGKGTPYSTEIIVVDPHEYGLLMDWWHYIVDRAEVPATLEVVLSVSTPDQSAISDEEYLIYQLTPESRKPEFARALLAHF